MYQFNNLLAALNITYKRTDDGGLKFWKCGWTFGRLCRWIYKNNKLKSNSWRCVLNWRLWRICGLFYQTSLKFKWKVKPYLYRVYSLFDIIIHWEANTFWSAREKQHHDVQFSGLFNHLFELLIADAMNNRVNHALMKIQMTGLWIKGGSVPWPCCIVVIATHFN